MLLDKLTKITTLLENNDIDEQQAKALLFELLAIKCNLHLLKAKNVNKLIKQVSKDSWINSTGKLKDWKKFYKEKKYGNHL